MTRDNFVLGSAAIAHTQLSVRQHGIARFTTSPTHDFLVELGAILDLRTPYDVDPGPTPTPHAYAYAYAYAVSPILGPRSSHMRQSDEQWFCARSHLRQPPS